MNLGCNSIFTKPVVENCPGDRFCIFVIHLGDHCILGECISDTSNVGRFSIRAQHGLKKISMYSNVGLIWDRQWSQWSGFAPGGFALLTTESCLSMFKDVCVKVWSEVRGR